MDDGRFWDLLGEEVADETVRLIATKILAYWELSLVFQGADRSAKQLTPPTAAPAAANSFFAAVDQTETGPAPVSQNSRRDLEPDRPQNLTPAPVDVTALQTAAEAGRKLLEAARAECRRLATLAMLGGEEGELPAGLRSIIDQADAAQLLELTNAYREQTARRFNFARSSVEPAIVTAAPDRIVADTTLL